MWISLILFIFYFPFNCFYLVNPCCKLSFMPYGLYGIVSVCFFRWMILTNLTWKDFNCESYWPSKASRGWTRLWRNKILLVSEPQIIESYMQIGWSSVVFHCFLAKCGFSQNMYCCRYSSKWDWYSHWLHPWHTNSCRSRRNNCSIPTW